MDLGVIVGVTGGVVLVIIGILWGGGDMLAFFNPPSIMITVGASFASLFVGHPFSRVLQLATFVRHTLTPPNFQEERLITQLVAFSEKARREGLLALEDDLEEIEDGFLRKGIQLVVDGTDPRSSRTSCTTSSTRSRRGTSPRLCSSTTGPSRRLRSA